MPSGAAHRDMLLRRRSLIAGWCFGALKQRDKSLGKKLPEVLVFGNYLIAGLV